MISRNLAAYPGLSTYVLGAPEALGRDAAIADHLEHLRNIGLAERGFLTSEMLGTRARIEQNRYLGDRLSQSYETILGIGILPRNGRGQRRGRLEP